MQLTPQDIYFVMIVVRVHRLHNLSQMICTDYSSTLVGEVSEERGIATHKSPLQKSCLVYLDVALDEGQH